MEKYNEQAAERSVPTPQDIPLPGFDELVSLAKHHPEQFEALRIELCEQLIARAPIHSRRRLQGLQFQINMERQKSNSGIGTCIRLSQLMNESLLKLNAALCNPSEYFSQHYQESADVIPMYKAAQN
ncbi:MAG: DUF3135 domain-containing protein [Oleiphilus sp.]|nr:MAG: DUF3135 domain-containing protein [Oleiphilus sp.]